MTTEEGNKLIAEFMGWVKSPYPNTPNKMYKDDDEEKTQLSIHIDELKYHSSWDWLMPVVEKIESIKNSDDYEVDIFGNYCDIGGKFEAIGKTKIEATWKAIIQFIQWYNNQKQ